MAVGAEVITSEEIVNRLKEREQREGTKQKKIKILPKPKKVVKQKTPEPIETSESDSFSTQSTDNEDVEEIPQR